MIKKVDNLGYKSGNFTLFVEYPQHLRLLHNMSIDVGAKLRSVRVAFGLSQRALARRAGVTNGLISLIEQNRVSPAVSSLKKVLDGVPMSLAEFFTLDEDSAPQMYFAAEELAETGNEQVSRRLVAAERKVRQLSILHERYAPGAATGDELLAHRGEEGGVVIRGRIELTIGGSTRVLGPGDAYYFASQLPHRFRNIGREVCEIVSCVTPPRP
jgi:transcriptional regulator with XRE-family HTH domain